MIACLHDVLQGVGDGSSTRGDGQSGYTTLKGSHTILKHTLSGVGQTTVDITCIAQTETVGSVLRVTEHVRRGLVDGHGTGVSCGVSLFLAYMELQCLKTIILLCTHSLILSFFIELMIGCFRRCKGTMFRNIYQISCRIQKICLYLRPEKNNSPFGAVERRLNRIKY